MRKNDEEKIKMQEYARQHPLEPKPKDEDIILLKTDIETLRFDINKNKPITPE